MHCVDGGRLQDKKKDTTILFNLDILVSFLQATQTQVLTRNWPIALHLLGHIYNDNLYVNS